MAKFKALSDKDERFLKEMGHREMHSPVNQRGRQYVDDQNEGISPEMYIANTPIGGISKRVGAIPGHARCAIYRIIGEGTADLSIQLVGQEVMVYNLSTIAIRPVGFLKVARDKFGYWIATNEVESAACDDIDLQELDIRCEEGTINIYKRTITLRAVGGCLEKEEGEWEFDREEGCCECTDTGTATSTSTGSPGTSSSTASSTASSSATASSSSTSTADDIPDPTGTATGSGIDGCCDGPGQERPPFVLHATFVSNASIPFFASNPDAICPEVDGLTGPMTYDYSSGHWKGTIGSGDCIFDLEWSGCDNDGADVWINGVYFSSFGQGPQTGCAPGVSISRGATLNDILVGTACFGVENPSVPKQAYLYITE